MLNLTWPAKHHAAAKNYGVDWGKRFPGDPLVRADFAVVSGVIELGKATHQGSVAQVLVSGGLSSRQNALLRQPPHAAVVSCTVETESGQVDAAEIAIATL